MTIFGAIRWDGVHATGGEATTVANALSPAQWHERAPFWATEKAANLIQLTPTQAGMDAEIAAAVAGGLDYWAFLLYDRAGPDGEMMKGYDLFQSSENKDDINWAMIRNTKDWGATGDFAVEVAEAVAQVSQSNYQMVQGNRPLVFVYGANLNDWGGSWANLKVAIDAFRADVQTAGLGNPYIVVMPSLGSAAAAMKSGLGADAATLYARGSNAIEGSYADLRAQCEAYWPTLAASAGQIVPLCMAGWDRRPRIARPTPSQATTQRAYFGLRLYSAQPTPAEMAAHVEAALNYVLANYSACPADAVLCYAWNEFDEGGWLCPTLGDPTGARLASLASVLA